MLLTGSGTSWTATEAPLPGGAATNPLATLTAAACPSATSCVATGTYSDSSGYQGLLVSGSGTTWRATQSPLPGGAATNPFVGLPSVACASASSCTAVGSYQSPSSPGNSLGLLVTGSGGSWTASQAPMPANATTSPNAGLSAVACPAATSCAAAGFYEDSSNDQQGLLVTGSGTSWTAAEAPLPAGAAANPDVLLPSVACASGSSCTAVGRYAVPSGGGLLLTGSGTSWTASEAPQPPTGPGSSVDLNSVACPSTIVCAVAGDYTDSSGNRQGVLLTGPG
jgi:hypothetical protein